MYFESERKADEGQLSKLFLESVPNSANLSRAIELYKELANGPSGYLRTRIFERMRDGQDDLEVENFFAGPFAEVRTWLPEMFGTYISRFSDYPQTYIVADNLSDEYGKYVGKNKLEPSHALLYRRVLEELHIPIKAGTMTTPANPKSAAAAHFRSWFEERVNSESPEYLMGHFLAYEITDVLDFPDYTKAANRMWPNNMSILEFFTQHAGSGHDASFAADLGPLFKQNRKQILSAMSSLLEHWTRFYLQASEEVKR